MPDFFEQMCQIIAESGGKSVKIAPDSADLKQFFSDVPKVDAAPEAAAPRMQVIAAAADPEEFTEPEKLPVSNQTAAARPEQFNTLDEIRSAVLQCGKCGLCRTRKNAVPGEGNPDARLMFIGEGPGADEDLQGRPFVGKAGQLLDKMIAAMQFTREEVFIANIVKCRPPDNRLPAPEEADICIHYLRRQIELVRPEVIVLLGATAVKYLLNVTTGISRMRGRWLSYENIPVMATFHPAFLLRQESAKRETWNDLQQVMARFGKFHKPQRNGGMNR